MKYLLLALCVGVVSYSAFAQSTVVCETDRNGRMCCWDTKVYGPWRPITCG
jgi:hypothetical protein